jgi:hypothetical protein
VKTSAWRWLLLLVIPGCILVQPLDEAKPEGSAGSGNSSGKSSQAGAGHASGSPGAGGSGNKAGAGPLPAAGAANGGAASGADYSLFVGTWVISGGKVTSSCEGADPTTDDVTPGGQDTIGLGTLSDLIFGVGSECEILADVANRTASLNPATLPCSFSDATYDYYSTFESFEFVVASDGLTAKANVSTSVLAVDFSATTVACDIKQTLDYKR